MRVLQVYTKLAEPEEFRYETKIKIPSVWAQAYACTQTLGMI